MKKIYRNWVRRRRAKVYRQRFAETLLYDQNADLQADWLFRVQVAVEAPDNAFIPRHPEAGTFRDHYLVMYNGLLIHPLSCYGVSMLHLLIENKGVHEPQEERVFHEVLKQLPEGATMIELGSYWAFYSMCFQQGVKNARNIMVEPNPNNLTKGKSNFLANGMEGTFINALVGKEEGTVDGQQLVCIDGLMESEQIHFLDVLHSDIQGYEYEMLEGASQSFANNKIGYAFISTHSEDLHQQCMEFLQRQNFIILAEASPAESYSRDGLIAARASHYQGIEPIPIAKRKS